MDKEEDEKKIEGLKSHMSLLTCSNDTKRKEGKTKHCNNNKNENETSLGARMKIERLATWKENKRKKWLRKQNKKLAFVIQCFSYRKYRKKILKRKVQSGFVYQIQRYGL